METVLPYLGVEAEYTEKELANLALTVPNVVNWSSGMARSYASDMGFEVEIIGNGSVVRSQSPVGGAKVESDHAKLILYTDTYADRVLVTVPDLSGMTAVAANETLASRGLNIRIEGTNNYLSGTGAVAISQSPAAGTEVERGTVVTVTFRNKDDNDLTPT
jgi:stage V sporulation protein D (sporulation-specific penicillin-binding protein)